MTERPESTPPLDPPAIELDLFKLVRFLYRRRWVLLGAAVAGMIAGGVYLAVAPRVYEAKAVAQIGWGEPGKGMINSNAAKTRAELMFGLDQEGRPLPRVQYVNLRDGSADLVFVELVVRATSPKEAQDFARAEAGRYLAEFQQRHRSAVATVAQRVEELKSHLQVLENQYQDATRLLDGDIRDPFLLVTALTERGEAERQVFRARQELERTKIELLGLEGNPARISYVADVPEEPASPIPVQVLILAAVAGLFLGVVAAAAHGFWTRNADRLRADDESEKDAHGQ